MEDARVYCDSCDIWVREDKNICPACDKNLNTRDTYHIDCEFNGFGIPKLRSDDCVIFNNPIIHLSSYAEYHIEELLDMLSSGKTLYCIRGIGGIQITENHDLLYYGTVFTTNKEFFSGKISENMFFPARVVIKDDIIKHGFNHAMSYIIRGAQGHHVQSAVEKSPKLQRKMRIYGDFQKKFSESPMSTDLVEFIRGIIDNLSKLVLKIPLPQYDHHISRVYEDYIAEQALKEYNGESEEETSDNFVDTNMQDAKIGPVLEGYADMLESASKVIRKCSKIISDKNL
jgi:hypothetical protein